MLHISHGTCHSEGCNSSGQRGGTCDENLTFSRVEYFENLHFKENLLEKSNFRFSWISLGKFKERIYYINI